MALKGRRGHGPVETSAGRGRRSRVRRAWRRVRASSGDGSDHAQDRHGKEHHADGTISEGLRPAGAAARPARARLIALLAEQGRSPQRWSCRPLPSGNRRRSARAMPRQAPLSERMNITGCCAVASSDAPAERTGQEPDGDAGEKACVGHGGNPGATADMRETSSVRAAFQRPSRRLGVLVRTSPGTARRGVLHHRRVELVGGAPRGPGSSCWR